MARKMSCKRPLALTSTINPYGICTLDEDHHDSPSSTPKQQLTLNSFFVTTQKRLRKVTPVRPASADAMTSGDDSPTTIRLHVAASPAPKPKQKRLQQVYLDCGQSDLGQQLCGNCGMLYVPGVTEDVQAHNRICRERSEGLLWRTIRGQRVHSQSSQDSIVSIHIPESKPAFPAALAAVYRQVVQDLGMDETASLAGYTIWLYLRNQRVVGFVATQPVSVAYSLLADGKSDTVAQDPVSVPTKVMLGVAILWTHDRFRHKNIATELVTAARQHSFFGMMVPLVGLAFSTPTQAGLSFAKKYCGGSDKVLIYKYEVTTHPADA